MLRRTFWLAFAAMIFTSSAEVSTAKTNLALRAPFLRMQVEPTITLEQRFSKLRRGINLSHWFAQSVNNDYSKTHLDSHTTAQDIALIKKVGFDHVRLTLEPAPLFNEWDDPSKLHTEYLGYVDKALDV